MGKSIDILKKQLNAQSGSPPKTWKVVPIHHWMWDQMPKTNIPTPCCLDIQVWSQNTRPRPTRGSLWRRLRKRPRNGKVQGRGSRSRAERLHARNRGRIWSSSHTCSITMGGVWRHANGKVWILYVFYHQRDGNVDSYPYFNFQGRVENLYIEWIQILLGFERIWNLSRMELWCIHRKRTLLWPFIMGALVFSLIHEHVGNLQGFCNGRSRGTSIQYPTSRWIVSSWIRSSSSSCILTL